MKCTVCGYNYDLYDVVYAVYWQSADSYHNTPTLPKAIFSKEENAIAYAKRQGGYGYGRDWFVKPYELDSDTDGQIPEDHSH
jgi:hypothetical protein